MGASNFEDRVYGVDNLTEAYEQAVADALTEYGHEPYNGTISTTSGVVPSPLNTGKPIREDRIDWEAVSKRLDRLHKWENCEALRIAEVTPARTEDFGSVDIEVKIPSDTPQEDIRAAVLAEVNKVLVRWRRSGHKATYKIDWRGNTTTRVLDKDTDYTVFSLGVPEVVSEAKTTTKATSGKTVTKYFILPVGRNFIPDWSKGYPTQAAARAALPTGNADSVQGVVQSWEIISMSRREDGSPLVTHEVDLRGSRKSTTYKASVNVHRIVTPAKPSGRTGWLFYGWAAE